MIKHPYQDFRSRMQQHSSLILLLSRFNLLLWFSAFLLCILITQKHARASIRRDVEWMQREETRGCRHTCYSNSKSIQLQQEPSSVSDSIQIQYCFVSKTDKRCINTVNEYSIEFKWGMEWKNFWVIRSERWWFEKGAFCLLISNSHHTVAGHSVLWCVDVVWRDFSVTWELLWFHLNFFTLSKSVESVVR